MLFSDDKIANFISDRFEATWQSVRPVPIVQIDFGNGRRLTRTLHGNIATYICSADGSVLDILPGIYHGAIYQQRLGELVLLHAWMLQDQDNRVTNLQQYHRRRAEALGKGEAAPVVGPVLDRRKSFVEGGARWALQLPVKPDIAAATSTTAPSRIETPEDLHTWTALSDDTRVNESVRRRLIHEHLADKESRAPVDITRWLYREVLHADLDDPYLGLREVLFANYPFAAEDLN